MQKIKPSTTKFISTMFASFIIVTSANAGPPIAFDTWSEAAGVISVDCPLGFSCLGDSSDQGMMQRIMYDSNGDQYIHQVITEFTALEGNMTLEAFVFSSNGTAPSGIAAKQHIYHDQGSKDMDVMTYLNTGWANEGENAVQIDQKKSTVDPGNSNIYYEDAFTYYERRDTTTQEINGRYISIDQGQLGSTYFQSLGAVVTTQTDQYSFVNRQASGVFNPAPAAASLSIVWPGAQSIVFDANGATPGTVSWNAEDEVRMVWWGQYCSGCSGYTANMSLQILENITLGTTIAGQKFYASSPEAWPEPPFGALPTLIQY